MSSHPGSIALLLVLALAAPAAGAVDEASIAMRDFLARRQATGQLAQDAFGTMPLSAKAGAKAGDKPCLDSDGDGLSDCVETGTGVFQNRYDTGTSRTLADTDGDGLRDGDEVLGAPGLDLPALGVSPLRKDLLLEYDWFEDSQECSAHSHRPTDGAIARVAQVYASAPVVNPDGSTGIHVVQDYGQGGAFTGGGLIGGTSATLPGMFDETYLNLKAKHFAAPRAGYFHYVMFAHRYAGGSNSSGYAEIVGDDVIVTMYCYPHLDDFVANTIVHELGHNLGLLHGGFEYCNGKPNYNSLMNYRYQFAGVDTQCTGNGNPAAADLSRGTRVPLDERGVDERMGVCGSPAIDWNGNGIVEASVGYDLNPSYNDGCGSNLRVLDDFDDWSNLEFAGVLDGTYSMKSVQSEIACGSAPAPVLSARRRN